MSDFEISDKLLVAVYGLCHPKWSENVIRLTIRKEHDRNKDPGKDIEGKYPARSHDYMPPETEFANSYEDAHLDVETRSKCK